jgi:hypothetical protein
MEPFPFVGEPLIEVDALLAVTDAGISSHSPFDTSSFLRKKGHSVMSMVIDSFASAVEMATGEDFTTAVMTSAKGRALRFREGVEDPPVVGLEKSLRNRVFRPAMNAVSRLTSRHFLLLHLAYLISICDVLRLELSAFELSSSLVCPPELPQPSAVIL